MNKCSSHLHLPLIIKWYFLISKTHVYLFSIVVLKLITKIITYLNKTQWEESIYYVNIIIFFMKVVLYIK